MKLLPNVHDMARETRLACVAGSSQQPEHRPYASIESADLHAGQGMTYSHAAKHTSTEHSSGWTVSARLKVQLMTCAADSIHQTMDAQLYLHDDVASFQYPPQLAPDFKVLLKRSQHKPFFILEPAINVSGTHLKTSRGTQAVCICHRQHAENRHRWHRH